MVICVSIGSVDLAQILDKVRKLQLLDIATFSSLKLTASTLLN